MTQQQSTYDTDSGSPGAIDTQWTYTHYSMAILPPVDPGRMASEDNSGQFGEGDVDYNHQPASPEQGPGAMNA